MAGDVLIDDVVVTKPGVLFDAKCRIRIRQKAHDFVSRGGVKLSACLNEIDLKINDVCCIDVGISTGGFTDALLRHGALHVLGIDVAYGMLDYSLRKTNQITLLERTNARYVTKQAIEQILLPTHVSINDFNVLVMDVSFISIFKLLPHLRDVFEKVDTYIVLIKPQFEAERHMIEPGGVVKNEHHITDILTTVKNQFNALNFNLIHLSKSCIKGVKGNQEYFAYLSNQSPTSIPDST